MSGLSQSIYFAERVEARPESSDVDLENSEAKPEAKEQAGFKKQLSEEEQKKVQKLKERDTEVRAHERAHSSAGGHMAGAPHYSFETGPDGQKYAVEGDVEIRMPSSDDPAVRLQEARQVKAAATAPSRPSSQDMKVAAEASKIESEALAEMRQEQKLSMCESCGEVHGLDRIQAQIAGKDSSS